MKVTAQDYYDTNPAEDHQPGDIWIGLPTHGLLRQERVSGIVITPACDLQNNKVETLTYLPIIPIKSFLCGFSGVRECKRETMRQMKLSEAGDNIDWPEGFTLPPRDEIERLLCAMNQLRGVLPNGQRQSAADRAIHGLTHLLGLHGDNDTSSDHLQNAIGNANYQKLVETAVRNQRLDTHFLPADRLLPAYSAVPNHSVALFRFPLTAPFEVFDIAQRFVEEDWDASMRALQPTYPMSASFRGNRPLKKARLRKEFLVDLITRYSNTYSRIGSPDFSEPLIAQFVTESSGVT